MTEGSIRWFWQGQRVLFPSQWAASTTNILTAFDVLANQNALSNDSLIFDALTLSTGYGLSIVYNQVLAVQPQIYLQTATGTELDLIAQDYFGTAVQRTLGQSDTSFRSQIQASFFNIGPTYNDIYRTLTNLVGTNARILQQIPQQQAWNVANWGYDTAGIWCSRTATAQVLIQMPRQPTSSQQTVVNNALALTRPAGVRLWAETNVYGPPYDYTGVTEIPARIYPLPVPSAPYIVYMSGGLSQLLAINPGGPYTMTMSSELASLLAINPQAPTILTMSAELAAALA